MNKQIKMAENQQTAKELDIRIEINVINLKAPAVTVYLSDGAIFVHQETFALLPNVPLESYVQYTFGVYNASIHQNQKEN